ncbi:amino acid transporter AVT6B-like isoform X2 [Rhododendron vialii]|uniref:amino acid transporter AVT6B-like isoform X2 n=1 Tax=Rhododendron vialii TaxID=182163 RepID=UPI00265F761D|nr:amino acid transporter AVT6B-like isoform X2 [Rhododendron vialii]
MEIKSPNQHNTTQNPPRNYHKDAPLIDENAPLVPPNKIGDDLETTQEQDFNGASFSGAVLNLSTTIIGVGIMSMPAAMRVLGLGLGVTVIVVVAVLTEASIEMLLRFSRISGSGCYGGVMGDAFGNRGRKLLQVCVIINNVGVLIVYMIIMGDVLSGTSSSGVHHAGILEGWFGEQWWTGRGFVVLVTTLAVLAPLAFSKRIVHTIGNELKDSLRIQSVVQTSLALCSSVYILTSFFGFLLFGDSTQDDVLANFDTDLGIPYSSLLNDLVRITYALHLMLVFPILFHPLRLNVDGLFFPSAMPLVSDNSRFALITLGLISLVYLGANFIPSIWDAFQFTGATAAVCLGFIFPAAIALRDPHGIATKKDKILSVFMICIAAFANLVAIYSDAYALFTKNASRSA